jgi:hypothetical protein
MKTGLLALSTACIATLVTGCANTESNPPNYVAPAPPRTPAYTYPPQTVYPAGGTSTGAQPGTAAQSTSAPQGETIPPSPGPEYVWMPSYWAIAVNGSWEQVGGHYVLRQNASEEQLRAARGMLEQARVGAASKSLKYIENALDEVNSALKVK